MCRTTLSVVVTALPVALYFGLGLGKRLQNILFSDVAAFLGFVSHGWIRVSQYLTPLFYLYRWLRLPYDCISNSPLGHSHSPWTISPFSSNVSFTLQLLSYMEALVPALVIERD